MPRPLPLIVLCLSMAGAVLARADAGPGAEQRQVWNFQVLLDDKEVGFHQFRVSSDGEQQTVQIDARFDVRILFFNAYSYRHHNTEHWRDGCLAEIRSETTAGREKFSVQGTDQGERFDLETLEGNERLEDGCIRSFAYWNPAILSSDRLLNSQTGEWIAVQVTEQGDEPLEIQGRQQRARRFALELPDGVISLWYSPDGRWLALEAPAPGGRKLHYRPITLPSEKPGTPLIANR